MENRREKEKEREAKLRQLREMLEAELADQLPPDFGAGKPPKAVKSEEREVTDPEEAKRILEAILFTASRPMSLAELKRVLRGWTPIKLEGIIRELQSGYEAEGKSFRIKEVAGGFEMSTAPQYAPWLMKLETQRRAKHATQSALETLAILAYKQPITRAEIEDLRGVDVSGVVSTLLERQLIKVVGRKEIPGRPFLYGTTDKFLEHFGLKSLEELPDISEIKSLIESSVRKEDLLPAPAGTVVQSEPEEKTENEPGEEASAETPEAQEETAHEAEEVAPEQDSQEQV